MKKGQIFSLEVMVVVTVFIVLFVFVVALVSFVGEDSYDVVQEDSQVLTNVITQNTELGLVRDGKLDVDKYAEMSQMDYDEVRQALGISSEFCIFIEDENGNVITITMNDQNITEIGSNDTSGILINGEACGQ